MSDRVSAQIERVYSFEYTTQVGLIRELVKKRELKNALRIFMRLVREHDSGTALLVKNEAHLAGYGVLRKLPTKYRFGSRDDYILGPYFVHPEFRKRGLGSEIVWKLCSDICKERVWAYVMIVNIASSRILIDSGFSECAYMIKQGKFFVATGEESMIKLYLLDKERDIQCTD